MNRRDLDDLIANLSARLDPGTIQSLISVLKKHSVLEIIESFNNASLNNPAKRLRFDSSVSSDTALNDLKASVADISARVTRLEHKMSISAMDEKPIVLNDGQAVSKSIFEVNFDLFDDDGPLPLSPPRLEYKEDIPMLEHSDVQCVSKNDLVVAVGMPNVDSTKESSEPLTVPENTLKQTQAAQQATAAQQTTNQQSSTPGDVKGKASGQLDKAELELKRQQVAEMLNKAIEMNTEKGRGRSTIKMGTFGGRGGRPKAKYDETVVWELSSDEDDGNDENGNRVAVKKTPSPTEVKKTPLEFEPTIKFEAEEADFLMRLVRYKITKSTQMLELTCSMIYIGSYMYIPTEKVVFTEKGIRIVAPNVEPPNEQEVLNIQAAELVRLIYHISKSLSVIFLYTAPICGTYVRESLEMGLPHERNWRPYYNPLSEFEEHFRRIVLVLHKPPQDVDRQLSNVVHEGKLKKINIIEANELLERSIWIQK